jgi:hypothetical protein
MEQPPTLPSMTIPDVSVLEQLQHLRPGRA